MTEDREPQTSRPNRSARRHLLLASSALGALLLVAACTPVKPPAGDTTPPGMPTIDLDEGSINGPPFDDNITNDTTPTFVGKTEADANVRIVDDLTDVGVGVANVDGDYSVTLTEELAPGAHTIRTLAIDTAGNQSEPSVPLPLTIDTTPPTEVPSTPNLTTEHDSGISTTDNVTNVDHPTFTGTGSSGLHVRLLSGAQVLGTGLVDGSGDWSIYASGGMGDGTHPVTATHVDPAGNVSPASGTLNVTIDTTAPAVGLNAVTDPNADGTPVLSGAAGFALGDFASVTVNIYQGTTATGTPHKTFTTVPTGATWSDTSPALVDDVYTAQASQTDVAGNTGFSPIDTFTVDTP